MNEDEREFYTLAQQPDRGNIQFVVPDFPEPVMEFKKNGDVYVKGVLTTNNMEIVEAAHDFFKICNRYCKF